MASQEVVNIPNQDQEGAGPKVWIGCGYFYLIYGGSESLLEKFSFDTCRSCPGCVVDILDSNLFRIFRQVQEALGNEKGLEKVRYGIVVWDAPTEGMQVNGILVGPWPKEPKELKKLWSPSFF